MGGGEGGEEPEIEPVVSALRADPSAHVRMAAAHALVFYLAFGPDLGHSGDWRDTYLRVLRALAETMVKDEDAGTRSVTAFFLHGVITPTSRSRDQSVPAVVAEIVVHHARMGLADEDEDVVGWSRSLLGELGERTGEPTGAGACNGRGHR